MANPNLLALIGAVSIVVVIAAGTQAAMQSGKSYNQCQREARAHGWNLNDEDDMAGANRYIAKCQHGENVRSESIHVARPRQPERRTVARQSDFDRRALAQAEPQYRGQAAPILEFCRDLAVFRAWSWRDEEDIGQANKFMADCMRGKIR